MTAEPEAGAPDGMSRRQLIRHAGWSGSAVVLTVAGGEVISHIAHDKDSAAAAATAADARALRFVQVSDSRIGFTGPANTDVTGSFTEAVDRINTLGFRPDFVMHTRTVGVFGFTERGWQPAPQSLISVLVEVATLILLAPTVLGVLRRPISRIRPGETSAAHHVPVRDGIRDA